MIATSISLGRGIRKESEKILNEVAKTERKMVRPMAIRAKVATDCSDFKFCTASGIHTEYNAEKYIPYTENETKIFIYHYEQNNCKAIHLTQWSKLEVSSAFSVNLSVKCSQIESNSIVSSVRNKRPWIEVKKLV